jgi:hypothetical protein
MADSLDCRIRALHCSEAARETIDPRVKDILADMAALWIKLARELERSHTQVHDKIFSPPIRKGRSRARPRQAAREVG